MKSNKFFQTILWLPILPLMLVLCFYAAWLGLSKVDFLYAYWYENTELERFINFYAPQNKFKKDFVLVDKKGRIDLFSQIIEEINSGGAHLADIVYYDREGKIIDTFLSDSERIHLEYVSKLVAGFKYASIFSLIVLIFILFLVYLYSSKVPSFKKLGLQYFSIFLLIGISVLIYGPENFFLWLHETVFPVDHQWHFYYQESLMTTLMMAPDLFAYIGVVWVLLSLLLFFPSSYLLLHYFSQLKNK